MRILLTLVLILIYIVTKLKCSDGPENEFRLDTWRKYYNVLRERNVIYPFRRLVMVYSVVYSKNSDDTREETRQVRATTESALTEIMQQMSKSFSQDGISVSSIRLPPARGLNVVSMLRLKETAPQPPISVALFSPDGYHASFIREVAESGALNGRRISWIVMSFNQTWNSQILTSDLGLRPDSTVIAINLATTGSSHTTQRWNGHQLESAIQGLEAPGGISLELTDYKLSIAVFQDPPFVYSDEDKNVKGWFVDIWKDIEARLKFTTTFYFPEGQGKAVAAQGSLFRRAAEELREGRADVVLGPFVLTEKEMDECDFSIPVTTIRYRFYVQRAETQSSESQFIKPFSMRLWYATWGTIACTATLMASTYLIGRYAGIESDGAPIYNIRESVLIIFGSLLQQGPDFSPNGLGGRIILWGSYAFGLVVYTAYAAALISSLTIRIVDPPFTTLDTMLASNFRPYMVTDSAVHRVTQAAKTGAWRELEDRRPRYVLTDSLTKSLDAIVYNPNVALLAAQERTLPRMQKAPYNCKISQLSTNILNAPGSMLLQRSSPYKAAIDQQLLHMWNTGRLDRYRRRWMFSVYESPCPVEVTLPSFALGQVTLPFKIFGGGICIAYTLLLCEYIVKKFFDTQDKVIEIRRASVAPAVPKKRRKKIADFDNEPPPPRAFLN